MPKKKDRVKKPPGSWEGLFILKKADVEQAMKSFEEEMMKDPEGAKMLKQENEELERAKKEGK